MRIAGIVQDSIVDGPGLRFVIFTQGCFHDCSGCQNMETHDVSGGKEVSVQELVKILLSNPLTDGVTFSGGEPFLQPEECAAIAVEAKNARLNVWTYTGYTFEELIEKARTEPGVKNLLELTDVLVDGRFVLEQRSLDIKWRGSKNQRLIDCRESMRMNRAIELE